MNYELMNYELTPCTMMYYMCVLDMSVYCLSINESLGDSQKILECKRVVCYARLPNLPSSNKIMFLMIRDVHFCPGSLVLSDQMILSQWTSRRLFACVANFGFDRFLAASQSWFEERFRFVFVTQSS